MNFTRALFFLFIASAAVAQTAPLPLRNAAGWIHGVPAGQPCTVPLQVHEAGLGTYILRENKCVNFEAPFMYLLLGEERALLLDSGAKPANAQDWPLVETVENLIHQWETKKPGRSLTLVVAHTHGHRDHHFSDDAFRSLPRTVVVGVSVEEVKTFFSFPHWPEGETAFELGGRTVTVFPIPGHEVAHLAFYDAQTGTLFSGDSVYPGLLTVRDWPAYRQSIARLVRFSEHHPITAILGAHIEMTRRSREMYPLETLYQPEEHDLFLGVPQLKLLHAALQVQGDTPAVLTLDDFSVMPFKPTPPASSRPVAQ